MKNSQILKLFVSRNAGLALAVWLVLEIVAFMFVAHSIGLFLALLLAVATSALGLADIRRLLDHYWRKRPRGSEAREGAALDGAMQALASLLLVLPGFASDFVGLALKSPSVREAVAQRLKGTRADPRIIDLAPGEWAHETKKTRKKRVSRKTSAS